MRKDKDIDIFQVTINLFTTTKFMVFGGLTCIVIPNLVPDNFLLQHVIIATFLEIAEIIGSTLFSAGLVSVLVEISTIKELVKNALNNVFLGDLPLDSYSSERLNEINCSIAAKRGNVDKEFIKKSIYSLEPRLIELLNGLYYNYYNAYYVITPDEKRGVFKKHVTLDYEIINKYENDNKVCHCVSLYDIEGNETKCNRNFKITNFKINKTDLTSEVEQYTQYSEINAPTSSYQYCVKFERKLQNCKSHKIKLEFEYEVPIDDISQIFRTTLPCKRTEHTIYMKNDIDGSNQWKVHGTAFTSFYCRDDESENGFHVEQKVDTNLKINFKNWCIPGAGYVVYFSKK